MLIELLVCPTPSLSVISPVSCPRSRPRPGVPRAEGVDFAGPFPRAKSCPFGGKEAAGALGPVAAEVARVRPRLLAPLVAAKTSKRGPQADSRHPDCPRREPRRPCKTGRALRRSPARRTIRPCTVERGPWAGRTGGHPSGRERSQGKLGQHLLAEAPPHGRVAAAGAIETSPATFDGNPRRCGTSVGGY